MAKTGSMANTLCVFVCVDVDECAREMLWKVILVVHRVDYRNAY